MIVEKIRNARTSNVIIPIIPVQTPIHIFIIISQNSELSSDTKYILDKLIPVIIIHSITSPLPIIYKRIFPIPQSKIVPFFILSLLFLRTEFRYINLFQKTLHFYHTCLHVFVYSYLGYVFLIVEKLSLYQNFVTAHRSAATSALTTNLLQC